MSDDRRFRRIREFDGERPDSLIEQLEQVIQMMKEDDELLEAFENAQEEAGKDVAIVLTNQEEGIGFYAHVGDIPLEGLTLTVPRVGDLFSDEDDTGLDDFTWSDN